MEPTTALTVKKTDIWKVPFVNLQLIENFNLRKDYGNIPELAESIRENGVKVPFRGYRDGETYFVIDGHRRYAACQILHEEGIELAVPFIVEPKGSNAESRIIDMFITNEGKQLTPVEQAEGISRLIAYEWEYNTISKKLGKSEAYIRKLHTLATAPKKLVKLIEGNKISATLAMDIIAKDGADKFLADYDGGKYKPETTTSGKEKKITSSQVKDKTSWQVFKEYAATAPEHTFDGQSSRLFKFMCRVMNNECTEKEFIQFFEMKAVL